MNTSLRSILSAGTALAAIGVLGLAATTASSKEGRRGPHARPSLAKMVLHHGETLGIDAATLARVEAVADESRARTSPLRESLREARVEIQALMAADVVDEAMVVARIESAGSIRTALQVERVETDIAVRRLLSAEQLQAIGDFKPQRREGMRGKGGRHGKRGHGPGSFDASKSGT